MTQGLKRYQFAGDLHFLTSSCFRLGAYLAPPVARNRFEGLWREFDSAIAFA